MPDLTQLLTDMAALLKITGTPATALPGQVIHLGLAPPLSPLNFTDIVQQDLDLDVVAKQVVFTFTDITKTTFPGDKNLTKILPRFNLGTIPPSADTSGVPGLIGKLTGKFPVALPGTAIPTMTVEWKVTDDNGNMLVKDKDFLAPSGLKNPTADITFLPAFVGFDGSPLSDTGRNIAATVTLTAGSGPTAGKWSGDIGPVRALVPQIPFPKVLALTIEVDFRGPALVMVPDVSAIVSLEHIRILLAPVRNAISALTGVALFADLLLGIDALSRILDSTYIVFSKANPVKNLMDITLVVTPWYEPNLRAGYEAMSFVYLSPVSTDGGIGGKVEMYNHDGLLPDNGKFTVDTKTQLVALCRDLNSAAPSVSPSRNELVVNNAPAGTRFLMHGINTFGGELCSINFL